MELCDWLVAMLTNNMRPTEVVRGRCVAGHKAMWNAEWGGLPEEAFFNEVDPLLAKFLPNLYN